MIRTGMEKQGWFIPSVHLNLKYAILITPSGWTGLGNGMKDEKMREKMKESDNDMERQEGCLNESERQEKGNRSTSLAYFLGVMNSNPNPNLSDLPLVAPA